MTMEIEDQLVGHRLAIHQAAIAMYRSRGQNLDLYQAFLRTRQAVFGDCTAAEFLLGRAANPALQALAPDELQALFLELAEEDLHRATS